MALLLLQNGADSSYKHEASGSTALHHAAYQGHEVVRVLIENRANVSAEDIAGLTLEGLVAVSDTGPHHQVVALLKAAAVSRAKCVA